jgi:putative transposase
MNSDVYLSSQKITKLYNVTSDRLRTLANKEEIRFIRPEGGNRSYHIEDIQKHFELKPVQTSNTPKKKRKSKKEIEDDKFKPFWNESVQELSNELCLPTKDNCTDTYDTELNSWFSVKSMTIEHNCKKVYPLLETKFPKTEQLKEVDVDTKPLAEKARKIRVYPDIEQRQIISKWLGAQRWIYNKALNEIKNNNCKVNLKELREKVINNVNFETENIWMLDYDYDLRDEALRDLVQNYKTNFAKAKRQKKPFEIKFRTKKQEYHQNTSLSILSKKWNKKRNFYSEIFRPDRLKSSEPLPDKLLYDSRLVKTPFNKYYITIPMPLDICETQAPKGKVISIDPGVTNFLSCYDEDGNTFVLGEKAIYRIARLLNAKSKLCSKIKTSKTHKKRYSLRKALYRLSCDINNLVTEMHNKICRWLTINYNYIVIPRLNFHNCKNLYKKHKEKMATLRHCEFVDKLIDKTREMPWCKVIECDEHWTSKTCGKCGNIDNDLGKSRTYSCKKCSVIIDRDINASRNILLRYVSKSFDSSVITNSIAEYKR